MAAMRGPRIPTGSAAWVADERASALQIVDVEVDEFTYAAQNEFEWLNEHMANIFNENETYALSTLCFDATYILIIPQKPRRNIQNTWKASRKDTSHCA